MEKTGPKVGGGLVLASFQKERGNAGGENKLTLTAHWQSNLKMAIVFLSRLDSCDLRIACLVNSRPEDQLLATDRPAGNRLQRGEIRNPLWLN